MAFRNLYKEIGFEKVSVDTYWIINKVTFMLMRAFGRTYVEIDFEGYLEKSELGERSPADLKENFLWNFINWFEGDFNEILFPCNVWKIELLIVSTIKNLRRGGTPP